MTENNDAAILEAARRIVEAQSAESAKVEAAKAAEFERLEVALKMALTRFGGDVEAAANLFEQWCNADSSMGILRHLVVREALTSRLTAMKKADTEVA